MKMQSTPTNAVPSGLSGSMTKMVPTPKLMTGMIQEKKMSGADFRGKSGSGSGGTMTGCTACGTPTKAIPSPKKM